MDELNALLGDFTPYRLVLVDPAAVELLEKNARYMTRDVYAQLVKNIQADRNLSSLPFLWKRADGRFVCLSGNHRVMGARDAGVKLILALYTDKELSRQEQVAIQLSHNSLVGADNRQTLLELWHEIADANQKLYSGLDDGVLKIQDSQKIVRVTDNDLQFHELRMLFTPKELEYLNAAVQRISQSARVITWVCDAQNFDEFFNKLLDYKESSKIFNTATAVLTLIRIADQQTQDGTQSK